MPARARSVPSLEAPLDFLQQLWQLNHALERMSQRTLRAIGITAQQRLLLRCIDTQPHLMASQLAALLHLDPGTVSVSIARLAHKGLVTRQRDPRDNRRVALRLTAAGKRLARPHPETVEAVVLQLLETASASDLRRFKLVLQRLADALLAKAEG